MIDILRVHGDKKVFWGVDYGQLELRFLAQVTQDPDLIKAVLTGDIHAAVGHDLTGWPIEKIKKDRDFRTAIKGLHFGIVYGLKPKGLFINLKTDAKKRGMKFDMDEDRVLELYNAYFDKYKKVRPWLDSQIAFAQAHGYVETLFGYQRPVEQEQTGDRKTFWQNQAVNSPIQGGAHTLTTIAVALMHMKPKTFQLLQELAMEGHDALYGYCKLRDLKATCALVTELMEHGVLEYVKEHWPTINWKVPLQAETKAGFRYGVLVPYSGGSVETFIDEWCVKSLELDKRVAEEVANAA